MTKLRRLLSNWPRGTLRLTKELERSGIGRQLLASYKESGWVESFDHGVYKQSKDDVDWMGAVYALQQVKGTTLHPGGKTALALMGYGHYIGMGNEPKFLYMSPDESRQQWLNKFKSLVQLRTNSFDYTKREYFTTHSAGTFPINISTPELACLEMLYLVPTRQTFDEAGKITEVLYSLRPELLQRLLQECRSIKVVRLLLFFADYHDHPWLKEIDMSKLNLGIGNRVIAKNGILSQKFRITVPKKFGKDFISMA